MAVLAVVAGLGLLWLVTGVRVVQQYERGVSCSGSAGCGVPSAARDRPC